MLYRKHSNAARPCQYPDRAKGGVLPPAPPPPAARAHTGPIDIGRVVAAVARAYTDVYLADDVTPAAILGPTRTPAVAWARHLCAYLLAEDHRLTNAATARALGRSDHTTAINSRERIAAALPRDERLARALERTRADLASRRCDEGTCARHDEGRRRTLAAVPLLEWYEYRYWRARALRAGGIR